MVSFSFFLHNPTESSVAAEPNTTPHLLSPAALNRESARYRQLIAFDTDKASDIYFNNLQDKVVVRASAAGELEDITNETL